MKEMMHINSLYANVFVLFFKNTTGKNLFFMQRSILRYQLVLLHNMPSFKMCLN